MEKISRQILFSRNSFQSCIYISDVNFSFFQIPIKKIKFKDVSHSMKSIKDQIKLKYNVNSRRNSPKRQSWSR
jgi:hypothetical protein